MFVMEQIIPELGGTKTPLITVKWVDPTTKSVEDGYPVFDIKTYQSKERSTSKNATDMKQICRVNNTFIHKMDEKGQRRLYEYYRSIKAMIDALDVSNVQETIREMSELTLEVFTVLQIPQRLIDFVRSLSLTYPDMGDKGRRSHDTAEKTFPTELFPEVTAVSFMCKMLSPILGDCIATFKPPLTGKENKEYCTYLVFESVLNDPSGPFYGIYQKLHFYIQDNAEKAMAGVNKSPSRGHSSLSFTITNNGFCNKRFLDLVMAVVMTKKLVSFDNFETKSISPDGSVKIPSILTYIYVVTMETTRSKLSTIQAGTDIMPRFDPTDGGDQESNTTQLENTARVSKISKDIPVLAELAVEIEVERILEEFKISRQLFKRSQKYYNGNPISPSVFNIALISSLFGQRIGGSGLIRHLTAPYYAQLLILMQVILCDWGYRNLATLMSADNSDLPTGNPITSTATRIMTNYNKTREYMECSVLFPGSSEKVINTRSEGGRKIQASQYITFDAQLQKLVDWIIQYEHRYNIPPVLWKNLGYEEDDHRPMTGDRIALDENIIRELCAFFKRCHEPKKDVV